MKSPLPIAVMSLCALLIEPVVAQQPATPEQKSADRASTPEEFDKQLASSCVAPRTRKSVSACSRSIGQPCRATWA